MGNFGLENRIKQAKEFSGEKLIIQADGYPMSGGEDDYNTTLQAVATADVINKAFNMELNKRKKKIVYKKNREVTNSLTLNLAKQSGVNIQGVCIGTFARNIIYKYVKEKYDYENPAFWKDLNNIKEACEISENLIKSNIN